MVGSESTAFYSMGGKYLFEVQPGEIVEIAQTGIVNRRKCSSVARTPAFCIFEYVYFAKADSIFEGR